MNSTEAPSSSRDHEIIVALDVPSAREAASAVKTLGDAVSFYKVGLELFVADGPETLRMLKGEGKRVFLDLKLHDIPRTVERAVSSCLAFGADLLTIHAQGCRAMVEGAVRAVSEAGSDTKIIAVTLLTSLDAADLADMGVCRAPQEQVLALGTLATAAGAHGLVCSPREVAALRRALGPGAILVTPGVRPAGTAAGDQKRIATPGEAIRDGATHLVVGRPILGAQDPRAAAIAIRREMDCAGDGR
ncbi:MAG: orotidine-5'-phosphate decarboxylase [Kiritimatiellae bacterium]|nr:orotidine-5'-phosphate decarboxylase [Kiritimatiellia bacterium]